MTLVSNYVGYSILEGCNLSLGVDEGKIISKKKLLEKKENLPIIIPGLIDLQVNGFKGFDLNSDDLEPETVESLSEELCKVASKYSENARIAVRNVRRDGMDTLKKLEKNNDISQDDQKIYSNDIQKLTDATIKIIDETLQKKTGEILSV